MKQSNSLHFDTNSQKSKFGQFFFVRHGKKWVWPIWSLDSKLECISRINRWYDLIFCMQTQIHTNWKVIGNFGGVMMVKNGCGQSGDRTLKLTVSEKWTDGINWFFAWWYRFTKIKSRSKVFSVGMVKNRYEQSGYGTLKHPVSARNKCMCGSSHALCYGRGRSCAIHYPFASCGGTSFVFIALTRPSVSEPKQWVTWSHRTGVNFQFLRYK